MKFDKIGIIGLGYVGMPLAGAFCSSGAVVVGYDVDEQKVERLRAQNIDHEHERWIDDNSLFRRFIPSSYALELADCEAIIICVPTPLDEYRRPDVSSVDRAIETINTFCGSERIVVISSTVYPGYTRNAPLDHFLIGFSPEREDPGNKEYNVKNTPKLVAGYDADVTAEMAELYSMICDNVVVCESLEIAESAKLLENVYRCVNIALVNELKEIFGRMDIDIWKVIEAASTKPYGFQPFYPGPGLGGHCIPIDPFYLSHAAAGVGMDARFIELAGHINRDMPQKVVDKIIRRIPDCSTIVVFGEAYKKNVSDTRESPALEIIKLLRGIFNIHIVDPVVNKTTGKRIYADADVAIIATDHDCFDYDEICNAFPIVFDTRNACRNVKNPNAEIVKL